METNIHVVIGVWGGCIEHVSAWVDEADADKEYHRLRKDYGIVEGHEAESKHAVDVWHVRLRE